MTDCLIPEIAYVFVGPTSPRCHSSFDADECCEDVIAKCHQQMRCSWLDTCKDKIELNRPPPALEWQDEVDVWIAGPRLPRFSIKEWSSFQEQIWNIVNLPHVFFTSNAGRTVVYRTYGADGAQALLNQVDYLLQHVQRFSLKEYQLLKDLSVALKNKDGPPVELLIRRKWWGS